MQPSGSPLSGSVSFELEIYTPAPTSCLMYEEVQTITVASDGVFSLTIDDGSGIRLDSTGYTLDQIFANQGTFSFTSGCSGSNSYTPDASDGRVLNVLFKSASMSAYETVGMQNINFIPMALTAKSVAGFSASNLLRFQESNGTLDSVSPLNNTQYNALVALVNGTSSLYLPTGSNGAIIPSLSSAPSSPSSGTIWYNSSSGTLQYEGSSGVQTIGASSGGSINLSSETLGDGTAASPSINFLGDTTTGIYEATTGELGLSAAGATALTVTSSVVNIPLTTASTSSATGALTVSGGVGIAGTANIGTSVTTPVVYGSSAVSGALTLTGTSNASAGNVLINPSGGNVGIGTTAPVSTLSVAVAPVATANYGLVSVGNGAFDGSTAGHFAGNSSGTQLAINAASGYTGDLANFQVAGTSLFKVDSSGNITSSNVLPVYQSYSADWSPYSGGTWQKFATINVGAQYNLLSTYIDVTGAGSWIDDGHAELFMYCKHQYLGQPFIEFVLISSSPPLTSRDFGYVVNSNGANTTVDLWFQSEIGGDVYQFQPRNLYATGSTLQLFNSPASQSSACRTTDKC